MTIKYTWKITGLKTADVGDRKASVVQTYWEKIGTDENGNEGKFSGATPFTVDPTDSSGPFIPFEKLTEEDVISWVKSIVVGDYEERVNSEIQKKINEVANPVVDPGLPWAPTPTPEPGPAESAK